MKILLVNDTSPQDHIGCYATMNGLRCFLQQNNIEILDTIFCKEMKISYWGDVSAHLNQNNLAKKIRQADLLIINGEGSLHDGNAPEIEFLIQMAIEAKTPFAAVNAYIRNYSNILPLLRVAEYVSVRDSASLKYLQENKVAAMRCADAAVFSNVNLVFGNSAKSYFTDWHMKQDSLISPIASKAFAMGVKYYPFRKESALQDWQNILAELSGAKIFSGRYHGTVFSCMAGAAQVILPSNTGKMADFAQDYGLEKRLAKDLRQALELFETDCSPIARAAQEKILGERENPVMHPLAFIKKASGKSPLPPMKFSGDSDLFDVVRQNNISSARRVADYLANHTSPNTAKDYSKIITACGNFTDIELRALASFAVQENNLEACVVAAKLFTQRNRFDSAYALLKIAAEEGNVYALKLLIKQSFQYGKQQQISQIAMKSLTRIKTPTADILSVIADLYSVLRLHAQAAGFYRQAYDLEPTQKLKFKLLRQYHLAGEDKKSYDLAKSYIEEFGLDDLPFGDVFELGKIYFINKEFVKGWQMLSPNIYSGKDTSQVSETQNVGVDLTTEIGVGAEVKYIGLLSDLAAKNITLRCDARLQKLLRDSVSHIKTVAHGKEFPDEIDQIIDYAELGLLTRSSEVEFNPPAKYLFENTKLADEYRKKYRQKFGGKPVVGISWYTPNKNSAGYRNVDLVELIEQLNAAGDFGFVSLLSSLPEAKSQVNNANLQEQVFVDEEIDPKQDLEGCFAQIAAMDFVVTIDCSVVHFAGALGVPTFMLASTPQIWKWPRTGSNSYWHESVSIIENAQGFAAAREQKKAS